MFAPILLSRVLATYQLATRPFAARPLAASRIASGPCAVRPLAASPPGNRHWSLASLAACLLLAALLPRPATAQSIPDSATRAALQWRSIGPVNMAGRITALAVNPARPKEFYLAGATGGVWKTVNAGTTFFPLWEQGPIASLGDIAVAPSNPQIVWLGSGEEDSRNSVQPGWGVYKSEDGGVTWQSMGLRQTQHVGRIVIHPTNPDIVYVAALGAQWGANPERGLYKTTDGGRSWTLSKFISDNAGFVDVAMDPRNPDVLYAASWERLRKASFFKSGGPGSGLWKSTNGGESWTEVRGRGFPETAKGRITVKLAPSNPDVVYAMVEADSVRGAQSQQPQQLLSGLYRSADAGASWTWVSTENRRPFYFSEIAVDPDNADRIYRLDQAFHVSDDGGVSWRRGMLGIHEDYHAMWINPADPEHFLVGGDAGLFQTHDGGGTYDALNNMAMSQFYGISYDYQVPYRVCGGMQDNGTSCGLSRRPGGELQMTDWFALFSADGLQSAQNPFNPDIVYFESQGGNIMRRNLASGELSRLRPTTVTRTDFGRRIAAVQGNRALSAAERRTRSDTLRAEMRRALANPNVATRWNWNTPFILSRHNPEVYYAGAEKLFKSVAGGADLFAISPDLSAADETVLRQTTGYDVNGNEAADATGGITRDATGAEENATIVTIGESPLVPGQLYVGTSDGKLWLTRNDGGKWEDLSGRFAGVPAGTYVSRVEPSRHDSATVYVSFDNHRDNDFTPYLFVSTNYGASFTSLARGIPRDRPNSVSVVREDVVNRDLLYIGTELGVSASLDRGASWFALDANLPVVPVYDLQVHPRDRELIAGTHGRGVQILDVAPLQQLTLEMLLSSVQLFTPAPAFRTAQLPAPSEPRAQRPWKGDGGPSGAVLRYRLATPVTGTVRLHVLDVAGDTLASLVGANGAGLHSVSWNLLRGGGGFRGLAGAPGSASTVQRPGFPPGYDPRPAEAQGAPDSSMTPAAVAARLARTTAGGGGGGGRRDFTAPTAAPAGAYRVVLVAGALSQSTVLQLVDVGPSDRAVLVPAKR